MIKLFTPYFIIVSRFPGVLKVLPSPKKAYKVLEDGRFKFGGVKDPRERYHVFETKRAALQEAAWRNEARGMDLLQEAMKQKDEMERTICHEG